MRVGLAGRRPLSSDIFPTDFDFQEAGPLEFIEYLKRKVTGPSVDVAIKGTHEGWILESDIPALIDLLDSAEPCSAVSMFYSSRIARQPSTVGREAAFLIAGFRSDVERSGYGGYPPSLQSARSKFAGDADGVRKWWSDYRTAQQ